MRDQGRRRKNGDHRDSRSYDEYMDPYAAGYIRQISNLNQLVGDLNEKVRVLEDDKAMLTQRVLELVGGEEGVADSELKDDYEDISNLVAGTVRKVFGKPTGKDHERLAEFLDPRIQEFLRLSIPSNYNYVLSHVLYRATERAVGEKYCVGAVSTLERVMESAKVSPEAANPGNALYVLKMLEDTLLNLSGNIFHRWCFFIFIFLSLSFTPPAL